MSYADLTAVTRLPYVPITFEAAFERDGGVPGASDAGAFTSVVLTVASPGDAAALVLGVHPRVLVTEAHTLRTRDVLPILWDDDYVTLVPGEARTLRGRFDALTGLDPPMVMVESLNAALHGLSHA